MFALARCTAPCARARGEPSGDGEPFMDLAKFIDKIVARFIGTKHERDIKKLQPLIAAINAQEAEVRALSDDALKTRVAEMRAQVQAQLKHADPADLATKEQWQHARSPTML